MKNLENHAASLAFAAAVPDPEVDARPERRRFTGAYKMDILRQADACQGVGAIGALLRREGLYSSHLALWRRQRENAAVSSLSKSRGRPPGKNPLAAELDRFIRVFQQAFG